MTPITRKHLSRRTVLRGIGATIALPWLDAMRPAFAAAEPSRPLRLAFVYVPNGVIPDAWTPLGVGRDYELSRILKPLEPFRDDLLVLSGLAHRNADALGDGPGDHARAGGCFLTGVHPRKTAGADIHNGVSADQIAAQAIGARTRLPSLELGCEDSRTVGSCDSGYSCAYTNTIAWRGPTSPLPPETNPRVVFERLFGADDVVADPEARARRVRERGSVLDLVRERGNELTGRLGSSDRRKVDEYLYAVREVERQIQRAETDSPFVPPIEKPSGIPPSFAEYAKLMADLQVLAFQADLTRIATLMFGREGSLRSYDEIGVPDSHHPLTHHRGMPQFVEAVTRINVFHAELFGYLLGRLRSTAEGDGTLLDRSTVVYGSAIADGDKHTHTDLPVLVAGGGGGGIRGGRHVRYPTETPMTNLYLSLLERMEVPVESIGDSTGKLDRLFEA